MLRGMGSLCGREGKVRRSFRGHGMIFISH
jgi:hypothetical protein